MNSGSSRLVFAGALTFCCLFAIADPLMPSGGDDHQSIVDAITAAGTGGTVEFGEGTFRISQSPEISTAGAFGVRVPTGYREVEWIASTGQQCIDLGFAPNKNTTGVVMSFNSGTYVNQTAFFGTAWAANGYLFNQQSNKYMFHGSGDSLGATSPNSDMTVTIVPDGAGKGVLTIEDQKGAWTPKTVGLTCTGNLKVFGIDKKNMTTFRLYRLTITERTVTPAAEDGGEETVTQVAVHDFIPCYRESDGEIGLYDVLSADPSTAFKADGNRTAKFDKGDIVPVEDSLVISGLPEDFAEVTPAYGLTNGLAVGDSFVCTAPASWTREDRWVSATCIGYKVYTNDVVYVEGSNNSFTYKHPDCASGAKLVWQWSTKYRVSVSAGGAGSVEVSGDGWAAAGETVSVTATPAEGKAFGRWAGDVVSDHRFDNPYVFVMPDCPVALTAAFRQIVYVRPESEGGDDGHGGTSWDDALATIPAALAKCDEPYVMLAEGLYEVTEAVPVTQTATICGSGERGSIVKTIAASAVNDDAHRAVFYLAHADARLVNLAVSGSKINESLNGQYGRGIYMTNGYVENCAITNNLTPNNWGKQGGGIFMSAGVVRNCLIDDNCTKCSGGLSYNGNGIYMTGGLVESCAITRNFSNKSTTSGSQGGGVYMTAGTLRNCLIAGNAASHASGAQGAGVYLTGGKATLVENCTIVNNNHATSSTCAGLYAANSANITVRNTIVRNNTCSVGELNVSKGAAAVFDRVCTTSEAGEVGVIPGDPVFVDPAGNDWHIGYGACVDVGTNADWMTFAKDLDGVNARIVGKAVDIGCYEFVPTGLVCGFDVTTDGALDTAEVTLKGSVLGAPEDETVFTWTLTDSLGQQTVRSEVGLAELALPMPAGFYGVTLAVSHGGQSDSKSRDNAFTVFASDIYVSTTGGNQLPYGSFANGATNILDALPLAGDGSTIHLADGIHRVNDRIVLSKDVDLVHEGVCEDCIVSGNTGACLILLDNEGAKIENIDVCGEYPRLKVTRDRSGSYAYQTMNGVRIGSKGGLVTNCIIESCFGAVDGAGVSLAAGTVVDSVIRGNIALSSGGGWQYGGGLYVGGGMVDRCVITNNCSTTGTGAAGGGAYVNGGTLRNSFVAYNYSSGSAGGVSRKAGTVANCTIVRNEAKASGGGLVGTAADCLVFGNMVNGVGVDVDDPGFVNATVDDFHLDASSTAIDKSVAEGIGELDVERLDRYSGGIADKGCFEFDQSVVALGISYERLSEFYPGEVAFKASAGRKALDAEKSWWTFDGTEPSEDNYAAVGVAVTNTLAPGLYTVRFKTILDGETFGIVKENWFTLNGETVYVNPNNPSPVPPYASWQTAAADINEAFKYMVENTTLVVSDGVYTVSSEQVLDRKVTVSSLNGPSVTSFVTRRPFQLAHKDARVEGFTIRDFTTWDFGGGMRMSEGVVSNCVFRKCVIQTQGGGGVNMTGGTLIDCEIDACYTTYMTGGEQHGSGIYANGSGCVIERCYVHGCYAGLWNGKLAPCLGAVSLAGGATMRNTVVTGNRSTKHGGVCLSGASVMENCTVVDNSAATAGHAGGVSVEGETASAVNTIVWNNTNTVDQVCRETTGAAERFDTCWTEDPLFKRRGDKWQLRTKSPCLNTGKPLDWMDGAKDFYGNPRIRYGKPDIGAVESPYDPGLLLMVR